ncbi:MAG: class I poly(R)-hydroxyalkanoic acid synthase [Silicimonas sp.]|nr:class I poly(R)-hydroxyalkanoic acid synthase [Silicimonas sp.]
MTTEEIENAKNLEVLNENLAKVEELSQRFVSAVAQKKQIHPGLQGPGHDLYMKAATAYFSEAMSHPSRILETQVEYWGKALRHFVEAQESLMTGHLAPPEDTGPKDRRFSNELWDTHPYFNFIKQQYMFSSEAVRKAVDQLEELDDTDKKRLRYFSQQIIDMMSPTNFFSTNPDALTKAVETNGQSLVDGLENLVRDIESSDGELLVTLADKDAFKVGENIGTAEGSVVFRNEILELIQYAPTTETVHKTPLVLFPPWINKFYILDLKPANSLIRWVVDQGYTLFVVSWKNPDASYRDFSLDDYIEKGYLTTVETVKKITSEPQVNAIGYCIAGTTLSLVLALMNKRGDKSIKSATFFTTLADFEDQGEVGVFLSNDFVDAIEHQVEEDGILESFIMSRTFSYLRSNDLIYGPAIRSYMLGEAPPAFDLLYWNGDGTNLPACMLMDYLRGLCQENRFAKGGIEVLGEMVQISDVKVPLCAVACETDHIAAWKTSYSGIQKMGARSKTFILSESGHIAGIVNPPSKNKYGHYMNDNWPVDPAEWQDGATYHEGSWWPHWEEWLAKRSGKQVPALAPGDSTDFPALAPAPGTYVTEKPKNE